MVRIFVSLFLCMFSLTSGAHLDEAGSNCSLIEVDADRLACYDGHHHKELSSEHRLEATLKAVPSARAAVKGGNKKNWFKKLESNHPNYISLVSPQPNNLLGDETHFEAYISFQYPFVEDAKWLDGLYFVYNGKFDFYYAFTERYESAPTISRMHNPGLVAEWNIDENWDFRLGYFHESNGQTVDEKPEFDAVVALLGPEAALSQTSRGWDYVQLRADYYSDIQDVLKIETDARYQVEFRNYCNCQGFGFDGKEDNLFWRDDIDHHPDISDYDGIRFLAERRFYPETRRGFITSLELKTGIDQPFQKVGGKVSLGLQYENFVLSFFYFDGYGNEPSTYHLRSQYFGAGLEFR